MSMPSLHRSLLFIVALIGVGLPAQLSAAAASASARELLADYTFIPDQLQRLDYVDGNAIFIVHFCGHCPTAASFMSGKVKSLYDSIEKEQLPIWLVCITPDKTTQNLVGYRQTLNMPNALFAEDKKNEKKISTSNIYQVRGYQADGTAKDLSYSSDLLSQAKQLIAAKPTTRYLDVADLENDMAKELAWRINRGESELIPTVVKAAKSSKIKEDAIKIKAALETKFLARQEELVAADATIQTFEALEALLTIAKDFDLEAAEDRYKALSKDKSLKDEITARKAYMKCEALIATGTIGNIKKANAGKAQIAKKYPDTHYGRKSAADIQ